MTHDIWANAQQHLNTYKEFLLQKTERQQTQMQKGRVGTFSDRELWPVQQGRLPDSAGPCSLMVTALETKMLFFFHIQNIPLGKVILIMQNIVREGLLSNSNTVEDEFQFLQVAWSQLLNPSNENSHLLSDMTFFVPPPPPAMTGLGSGSHTCTVAKWKVIISVLAIKKKAPPSYKKRVMLLVAKNTRAPPISHHFIWFILV